jgi:hypothetical protein
MTFTQILANEEARKLVDAIEELIGEPDAELTRICANLIATLEAGCGYKYVID